LLIHRSGTSPIVTFTTPHCKSEGEWWVACVIFTPSHGAASNVRRSILSDDIRKTGAVALDAIMMDPDTRSAGRSKTTAVLLLVTLESRATYGLSIIASVSHATATLPQLFSDSSAARSVLLNDRVRRSRRLKLVSENALPCDKEFIPVRLPSLHDTVLLGCVVDVTKPLTVAVLRCVTLFVDVTLAACNSKLLVSTPLDRGFDGV
jgi:hypothetical protein